MTYAKIHGLIEFTKTPDDKTYSEILSQIDETCPDAKTYDINKNEINFTYSGKYSEDNITQMIININKTEPIKTISIDIEDETGYTYSIEYDTKTHEINKTKKGDHTWDTQPV